MKVPPGLLDPKGQIAKGVVNLELNGNDVKEYGLTTSGKFTTCYVMASPGDTVIANIAINSGLMEEFADLVVDGVLRNSWPNTRGAKVFSYIFQRAVYTRILIGETRKATKFARMKVLERNSSNDLHMSGNQGASSVSSIKIQIYRKEPTDDAISKDAIAEASAAGAAQHGSGSGSGNGDAAGEDTTAEDTTISATSPDLGVCQRERDYTQYATWQDLNNHIDDLDAPSFEIGFFDGNKQCAKPKERVTKVYTGDYKLWASFEFRLRSAADLRTLGFEDVALHYPPNPPSTRAHSSILSEAQEDGMEQSTGAAQVDTSMDAMLVEAVEEDENSWDSVVKPKQAAARGRSKSVVAGEESEQPTTSIILGNWAKNAKSKPEPISMPETKGEEYIAPKKDELVLPGVGSAPADQAYLLRGATEEREEDKDNIETSPSTQTQSGTSGILARSLMQSVSSTPVSRPQRLSAHVQRQSSLAYLGLMAPSMTDSKPGLSAPSSNLPVLPVHIRRERRPSLPSMASSAPSSPHTLDMTTYNMPGLTSTPHGATAAMLPSNVQTERLASSLIIDSQSRPSTPQYCQDEIYNTPGHPRSQVAKNDLLATPWQRATHMSPPLLKPEGTSSTPHRTITAYIMSGQTSTLHPSIEGFSVAATIERHPDFQAQSLKDLVVDTPTASRSSQAAHSSPLNLHPLRASSSSSDITSKAPEAVIAPEHQNGDSNFDVSIMSEMLKTKSLPTTRLSTPELTETGIKPPTQPEPEDTIMTGTSGLSSPTPSAIQSQPHPQERPKHSCSLPTIRPSSPALSETPGETAAELNIRSELESSLLSSQQDPSTFPTPSDQNFEHSSTQNHSFTTHYQSFNHINRSPVLGSSQRLMSMHETETKTSIPVAEQARLHWQNHTPLNEPLGEPRDSALHDNEGKQVESPTPDFVVKLKGNITQRPQLEMITPPSSAQKRKAGGISGGDFTCQQNKVSSQEQHFAERKVERQGQELRKHKEQEPRRTAESRALREELLQQKGAEQRGVEAFEQQGNGGEWRWEEIRRQNDVARARMATAELQRKELQARYENALAVQKERDEMNELNKEAERLERGNAEIQAAIAAVYRGGTGTL